MGDIIIAILLGIIEGLTEFLPVSSTGHLFLCKELGLRIGDDKFIDSFLIFIQVGAITAVVVYFRQRILDLILGRRAAGEPAGGGGARGRRGMTPLEISQAVAAGPGLKSMTRTEVAAADAKLTPTERWRTLVTIMVATVPVLLVGYFAGDWIEAFAFAPGRARWVIAAALIVGGMLMMVIEATRRGGGGTRAIEDVSLFQAIVIGCIQILAVLFPGTSRSAATIMGGLVAGLSRAAAAEFSFFLAIPAMFAACSYKFYKWIKTTDPTADQIMIFGVGTVVSFLVAWVVIAAFMNYIRRYSFVPFALYRIALGGIVVLWILFSGG